MKAKKITIGYDFLKELGGLERVMFFHANVLMQRHTPELLFGYVSPKHSRQIATTLNLKKNIRLYQIGKGKNELLQLMLATLFPHRIGKIKTDMIISHSFIFSHMAFYKKRTEAVPYGIVINHPPNFLYGRNFAWVNNAPRLLAYLLGTFLNPFMKKLDKEVVRHANFVIANSGYTARRVEEIYGIKPTIVYPMLSGEFKLLPRARVSQEIKKVGIPSDFVFLHGRMIKDKRPDWALRAFSKIKRKEIALVISGTIEDEKHLRKLIRELGIAKRTYVVGKVSQELLVGLYNRASCFLMPSPKEDFGLTPIEAVACGCPVVGWNDGAGPSETIQEEINGLLANPYDIDDFARCIDAVLSKKWDVKTMSRSVQKFSEREIQKSLFALVEESLS